MIIIKTINDEIRKAIANAGIRHWEVAATVGIDETTLVRWLRSPLTDERKKTILKAMEKIKKEKQREEESHETLRTSEAESDTELNNQNEDNGKLQDYLSKGIHNYKFLSIADNLKELSYLELIEKIAHEGRESSKT
jgi:hypothetical protein